MRRGCVCLYLLLWRPASTESHLPSSSGAAEPPLQGQHPEMRVPSAGAGTPCPDAALSRRPVPESTRPTDGPEATLAVAQEAQRPFSGTPVSKHGSQPRSRIINYGNSCLNESDSWRSTAH